MEDKMIVELYWNRDERAIWETEQKYGKYLLKIANNILCNLPDSEESVNDTYFKAWKAMPPHRPQVLSTFLAKITRHISIDIYRKRNTDKRKASEYSLTLVELEDCLSSGNQIEEHVDAMELAKAIHSYLKELSQEQRILFIGRYFFHDSIQELTHYYEMSESKVKSMLHRTRAGLKTHLEKEGFYL